MYDVSTKTVSKLSGELSSAFVEAAESNVDDEIEGISEETPDHESNTNSTKQNNNQEKVSSKSAE